MKQKTKIDGRRERSEPTRRQIIEAATALFGELGYSATTLEAIASFAKVQKSLIAYHFGGKLALYQAILRDAIGVGRELLAPVRELKSPAQDRLEAYIDALGLLFEQRPHFARTIIREWMSGGQHVEPEVMLEFLHFFRVDQEILEQGVRAGELRETNQHATHLALVGSLVFFEITRPLREAGPDLDVPALTTETFRDHIKDLLRRGLSI